MTNRLAAQGVWEKVLELIGDGTGHKILDAPAGAGSFADKLRSTGGNVYELDISLSDYSSNNRVVGDLNDFLPYKNEVFDKIVSVEGIEHTENPTAVIGEFSRVIKTGGVLILTTPNILNVRSRIKFLLTGCLFWFGNNAIEKYGHITPLSLYHLEYFCHKNGFKIVGLFFNRKRFWMRLLAPCLKVFGSVFRERFNRKDILAGEILILKLVKEPLPVSGRQKNSPIPQVFNL